MNKNNLISNLKFYRVSANLSRQEAADAVGVQIDTYAKWEQGKNEPSIDAIYNIMKLYNISANELFDTNKSETDYEKYNVNILKIAKINLEKAKLLTDEEVEILRNLILIFIKEKDKRDKL